MKNQNGMSILFVLVILGLLGSLIPFIVTYLPNLYKSTATQGQQQNMTSFIQSIRAQLDDGVSCPAVLGGVTIDPTAIGSMQEIQINLSYGGQPGPIAAGWNFFNSIQLSHVYLQLVAPVIDPLTGVQRQVVMDYPWNPPGNTPNPLLKFSANLILIPQNFNWNPNLDPSYRIISTFVNVDATGKIVQCHGQNSAAEACEFVMYGAYDGVNSPVNLRCNPDKLCFNSQMGVVSDPALCVSPYQGQQVGGNSYLCSWCNHYSPP